MRIDARVERFGWTGSFNDTNNLEVPIGSAGSSSTPSDWFKRANISVDPNFYDYRHIATACNMDRIINPTACQPPNQRHNGGKMVYVNDPAAIRSLVEKNAYMNLLHSAIYRGLSDAGFMGIDANQVAAQLTVNLIDFRDDDPNVTSFAAPNGKIYYGFERPCLYISELDYNSVTITTGDPPRTYNYKSYAVELYKPYSEDDVPAGLWRLVVDGNSIGIDSWPRGKSFYVIQKQDSNAPITLDPNAVVKNSTLLVLTANRKIELQRRVTDPNGTPNKYIAVDSNQVPDWLVAGDGLRSFQRDITKHKCIRRLWDSGTKAPTLGKINSYVDNSRPELIQARPANKPFTNIGEIGMLFIKSAYLQGPNPIGPGDTELTARLNLADARFQQIFNYLTAIDPADHYNLTTETRIKGRININTAPWFVIAQLPWVTDPTLAVDNPNRYKLAQAIVAYRDTTAKGFKSIGNLMQVLEMGFYTYDNIDLKGLPDLTPNDGDGIGGNFEERDVIFARISNLVTVRSDIFTAYILVRLGPDGPQKRVIAILDRSEVPADKVKIIALHPVPDPR